MFSKYFQNPKDKADFGIAIVVIILAGILIGYYSFNMGDSKTNQNTTVSNDFHPPIDTLEVDGLTYVVVATDNKDMNGSVAEKVHRKSVNDEEMIIPESSDTTQNISTDTETEETTYTDDEAIDNQETPDAEDMTDETVAEPANETIDDLVNDTTDQLTSAGEEGGVASPNDSPGISAEETDGTQESTTGDNTGTQNVQVPADETESSPAIDYSRDCIIIIGSYSSKRNVAKLIGRLDRNGYPVFKANRKGLTRVGIFEDCDSANATLKMIRKEYSKDAFIMKAR